MSIIYHTTTGHIYNIQLGKWRHRESPNSCTQKRNVNLQCGSIFILVDFIVDEEDRELLSRHTGIIIYSGEIYIFQVIVIIETHATLLW